MTRNNSRTRNGGLVALTLVSLTAMTGAANAANIDGEAVFAGAILDTCAVTVPVPGALGSSADATRLGSDEAGGSAAQAQIVTNNPRANLQVIAPTNFTLAPAGSDTDTTFAASHTIDGSTLDAGISALLPVGITTASVDASATKSSGAFEGGAYTMTVTVRCITE